MERLGRQLGARGGRFVVAAGGGSAVNRAGNRRFAAAPGRGDLGHTAGDRRGDRRGNRCGDRCGDRCGGSSLGRHFTRRLRGHRLGGGCGCGGRFGSRFGSRFGGRFGGGAFARGGRWGAGGSRRLGLVVVVISHPESGLGGATGAGKERWRRAGGRSRGGYQLVESASLGCGVRIRVELATHPPLRSW